MSGIDDLEFPQDGSEGDFIPDDALDELLDALEERGFDTSTFQYFGVNLIPNGESLRGTVFNSPGEAFDHFRNAGVPAQMIHLVWRGDNDWRVYVSGSP